MPPTQSYPSPNAAQVAGGAGPFFGPNGDAPPLPHGLQQLTDAEIARTAPPMMAGSGSGAADLANHAHQYQDPKFQSSPADQDDHQRLAQDVMSLNNPQGLNFPDDSPSAPRKRSKVSRACDECRRKKIRCDATADAPHEACTSCKRTGARCQFSRQPMKRGPSKGYIKELADRLNALEGQLGPGQHGQHADHNQYMQSIGDEFNEFSPPPGTGLSRKRTHSMSEGFGNFARDSPYGVARPSEGPWSADPQRHLPPPQTPRTAASDANVQKLASFSPNGMRYAAPPDSASRVDVSMQYDESLTAALEWDEALMEEYSRIIHPSFPLLSSSKNLRSRVANSPPALRDAFLAVLDCTVRSFPSSRLSGSFNHHQALRKASELISSSQFDGSNSWTLSSSLLYLQALVLMAIEADTHGPASRSRSGPSKTEWLGRAIGVACNLSLDVAPHRSSYADGENEVESDERLGRRIWAIIFILGHWHACSTATNDQIPATSDVFIPEENGAFGDSTFQLARLSRVPGHLVKLLRQPGPEGTPVSQLSESVSEVLIGELTFFRESVEPLLLDNANLVYICYWHFRLLVLRSAPTTPASDLLAPAIHVATLMSSPNTLLSPMSHHFAALAALALAELCDDESTRRAAEKGLDDIIVALNMRRDLLSRDDPSGWDAAVREVVTRTKTKLANPESDKGTSASGLQHLADAAIGGAKPKRGRNGGGASAVGGIGAAKEASEAASGAFDRTAFMERGYLGELAAVVAQAPAGR